MTSELLIATKNEGKIAELKKLLTGLPINFRNTSEFTGLIEPVETGATFAENAILKAQYYARETGILALADDSGLEVEVLNGVPGVFSARYGGVGASDAKKNELLLSEISKTGDKLRRARFVCAIALTRKDGDLLHLAEGICSGRIATNSFGGNGFGYDPIFIPDGFNETFAQLSDEIKQKISHRALAFNKLFGFLDDFLKSELDLGFQRL